jgi:hypothetical protein
MKNTMMLLQIKYTFVHCTSVVILLCTITFVTRLLERRLVYQLFQLNIVDRKREFKSRYSVCLTFKVFVTFIHCNISRNFGILESLACTLLQRHIYIIHTNIYLLFIQHVRAQYIPYC